MNIQKVTSSIPLLLFVAISPTTVGAKEWVFTPSLNATQRYSDNITLQQKSLEEAGFVTEISPGININRSGPRLMFTLNYRLQSIIYEAVNIDPRLNNQLQMNAKAEVVSDSIYIDSSSTIGQANSSSIGAYSINNYLLSNVDSTTYSTYRISPYWRPHLGGYAEGEVRFSYLNFGNSGTKESLGSGNGFGSLDSNSYQESINLKNGKVFDAYGIGWRIIFNNNQQNNVGNTIQGQSSDVSFKSVNGEITYRIGHLYSVFVQSGYYDNVYNGNLNTNNGYYLTPGIIWTPSPKFSLSAGYGLNAYFSTLKWQPSHRTSLEITYRDSQVGGDSGGYSSMGGGGSGYSGSNNLGGSSSLNSSTGNLGAGIAGSSWNGILQHSTRTTRLSASYSTQITTVQQYLSTVQTFNTPVDLNGNQNGAATANERLTSLPTLTNDVITSKRAQITLSWQQNKSNLLLSAYQNNVKYTSINNVPQDYWGINATYSLKISQRTNGSVSFNYQNTVANSSGTINGNSSLGETNMLSSSLRLNRVFSNYISGYLEYRHTEVKTNGSLPSLGFGLNGLVNSSGTYNENSISAGIYLKFN